MKQTYTVMMAAILYSLALTLNAGDVRIEKAGNVYSVTAESYTAQVNGDGALTSLVIGGTEFIAPPTEFINSRYFGNGNTNAIVLPGLYANPLNNWNAPYKPAGVREQSGNAVQCDGNGWKLKYTFLPDAIDLEYEGNPEGQRGFRGGSPPAELTLNLAHNLSRACDPANQGELGWPVAHPPEPADFAILAKNGAGFIAEGASGITTLNHPAIITPPHRLDLVVFNTYDQTPKPVIHRLKIFRQADLAHSVTMQVISPNRQHLFSGTNEVVFPVKVSVLYGRSFKGVVAFKGAPYVWKKPEINSEVPIALAADSAGETVRMAIKPPQPGHYTGVLSITDGTKSIYNKRIGFLYRPEQIPAVEPPADFDAFWDKTMAELAKTPLDLTMEERKDLETPVGRVYKVRYRSWGGRWAWAWLTVPKAEGKFAADLWLPPVSVYQPPPPRPADGFYMMAAIHGGDLKDWPAKSDFDYLNTGITSRETYMLRYSYCCLVRCFDILKNYEKCNGTVNILGSSQGAGLSLVLTGLRNAKSATGMAVALCRIDWTILGYTQWGPSCPAGQDPKKIAEVVRYFDPACFAHRIHTPLRLAMGLFDFCAPAEGIFTAINALPKTTPCEVFVDPYAGHFNIDLRDFNQGKGLMEVPRWYGTAAENKLVR